MAKEAQEIILIAGFGVVLCGVMLLLLTVWRRQLIRWLNAEESLSRRIGLPQRFIDLGRRISEHRAIVPIFAVLLALNLLIICDAIGLSIYASSRAEKTSMPHGYLIRGNIFEGFETLNSGAITFHFSKNYRFVLPASSEEEWYACDRNKNQFSGSKSLQHAL